MSMTLEEIQTALQDRKLQVVSEKTGISYNTIYHIKMGNNVNPNLKTLLALEEYFKNG